MKRQTPALTNDAKAEAFAANSDLTEHDVSSLASVRFELKPKDKAVNLRFPLSLFEAVREHANAIGISLSTVHPYGD